MKFETTLRVLAQLSFFTGAARSVSTTNSSTSATIDALLSNGNVDLGDVEASYQKAKAFVAGLTNAQKVSVITGESLTGNVTWTAYESVDGVGGINNQFFVSGFSMPSALITTWNKVLFEQHFKAMGEEFYDDGYNLINGPVSSPLGRVPEGGRQPEGFSPDPYLNGIATGLSIKGLQSSGVIATGRHFLLNEQETNRSADVTTRYSSNTDDKTIREIYVWPFADAVKAGMMCVMCAMNRVNDTLSCENSALLNGLLKTELGFPGSVLPDVQSQSTAFGSANGGLDYASGSQYWSASIIEAGIAAGNMTQARLDDMAIRSVLGAYYVDLVNGLQPAVSETKTAYRDVRGNHSDVIRQVGGEALVLLKNDNANGGGLPLVKPKTIALFGSHAGPAQAGPNLPFSVQGTDADIYQGHLVSGGGSGELAISLLSTPYQSISEHAYADRSMLWWIMNNTYTYDSGSSGGPGGSGGSGGGPPGSTRKLRARQNLGGGALGSATSVTPSYTNYAANAEVCICFINAASGEGADRSSLLDADQDTMILTVAETCNNTVVVANVAGPRVIGAWADHENVTAILYSGLLGEQSGNAIADVLYGEVNPSGKLAYTLVKNETDYPISICDTSDCDYTEGVYLDYRYFAAKNISVLYPFGHGLSYTAFTYDAAALTVTVLNATALASRYPTGGLTLGGPSDMFDDVVRATISIANTGARDGQEVAQLYLSFPAEAEQPARILRGFEKVAIAAGASAEVEIRLRRRDLSFWDVAAQKWAVASGVYTVEVGASLQDIKATATFTV